MSLLFVCYLLWMTVFFLNMYIVKSKNLNFIYWFILSLLFPPIVAGILMFFIDEKFVYEKTGDTYKRFEDIMKETRFKKFSWNTYCLTIEKLVKEFDERELLKLKHFFEANIESRKLLLTLLSIFSSIVVTFAVGMSVYKFTLLDNISENIPVDINQYQIIYWTLSVIIIILVIIVMWIIFIQVSRISLLSTLNFVINRKEK